MRRFSLIWRTVISLAKLADAGQGRRGRQYVLVVFISWRVVRQYRDVRSSVAYLEAYGACCCSAGESGRVHQWVRDRV